MTDLKIITHDEWSSISDALYHVRRSYNDAKKSDEERLASIELYLAAAIGVCSEVRKKWEKKED